MPRVLETSVILSIDGTTCGVCGVAFGIEHSMHERVKSNGEWFYCPNGHHIHYCEANNEVLKRRVKELESQNVNLKSKIDDATKDATFWCDSYKKSQRSVNGYKADKRRLLKRVHNGVCPHCNRTFADLAKHMDVKHPGSKEFYAKDKVG